MKDFNNDLPIGLDHEDKLWKPFFQRLPNIKLVEKTNSHPEAQQFGDFALEFEGRLIKHVETKTRNDTWIDQFQRDRCIAIEVVSNVQLGRYSSAITHSRADWYAYGFGELVENETYELRYPMVFDRKRLAQFIMVRGHLYPLKYSRNKTLNGKYYDTANRIIPFGPISHLLALPPTDPYIKRLIRKYKQLFVVNRY